MEDAAGFFASLFDFSFAQFVTLKIIKFLYGLGILLAGLGALFFIVAGFGRSVFLGLGALIISPVVFLIYAILVRVYLEILVVMFRIAENTREIAERGRKAA